jgi:hypothetical protein
MVKIRYAELPTGLHVATEAGDRCTIVYLKPGLTRAQRKDALTVARRSARFGHGPSLSALDMAFALAADRTRTTARITTSAMRQHPLLLVPVLALMAGIIAAGFLASAAMVTTVPSIRSAHPRGLYEFNIGQLVGAGVTRSGGPPSGAPVTGTSGAGSGSMQRPAHTDQAGHGRAHTRPHPAAGVPQAASARQGRGREAPGAVG